MSEALISVIVPMLNEREIVDETLNTLARAAAELVGPWEFVVVDAGSRDGTSERAQAHCARHGWTFCDGSTAPRSVGGTVSAGVRAARGEILLVLPADTSLPAAGFRELREAITRGIRRGGFPKRYVPDSALLRAYARLQNAVRFRFLHNVVWTNGIFFERDTVIPTVGFLEDVILSDRLKGPGWGALRTPLEVSARRYYPNRALRRIGINLSIMTLYRLSAASPARLRKLYVGALLACLCSQLAARPLVFSLVTGFVGSTKAGACGSTPVFRRVLRGDGKTCEYGFLTAAHCVPSPFRYVVIGENQKRRLRLKPTEAEILFGPDYREDQARSRGDEAMLFFSAPCEYLAEAEVSRFAVQRPRVGDSIVTLNQKGEVVTAKLTGAAQTRDQWQAKLEGKASIGHGDSGTPLWNYRDDIVGALSRSVSSGSSSGPFALSFDPDAIDWAKLTIEARRR